MLRTLARGKRWAFALPLAALVAAALLACDDDDDDDTAATATATAAESTATVTTTATATPTEEAAPTALELSVATDGALGSYLVGPDGRTLYVFTVDRPGVSNCAGQCLENWPPLTIEDGQEATAADAPGELGSLTRDDGTVQVTYNGAPLYYWAADAAPGDTTGHLVGGVFFVARPDTASTAIINVQTSGDLAPYLVGPDGMTLYVFANDAPGVSNCSGQCIDNWPPLLVGDGQEPTAVEGLDGELGVIDREDGLGRQVTYGGAPLYYWLTDELPGDTTGHGVGDFSVATPSGATSLSSQPGYDY